MSTNREDGSGASKSIRSGVLSVPDRIRNRACEGSVPEGRRGDRMLAAMILMHGLAMNGGVVHAIEACTPEERVAAIEAYAVFGLGHVADVFVRAVACVAEGTPSESIWERLDECYGELVVDDSTVFAAFLRHWSAYANQYAPL